MPDLITDGCNMGIKSLYRYLNQYPAADDKVKHLTQEIIDTEEKLQRIHAAVFVKNETVLIFNLSAWQKGYQYGLIFSLFSLLSSKHKYINTRNNSTQKH